MMIQFIKRQVIFITLIINLNNIKNKNKRFSQINTVNYMIKKRVNVCKKNFKDQIKKKNKKLLKNKNNNLFNNTNPINNQKIKKKK